MDRTRTRFIVTALLIVACALPAHAADITLEVVMTHRDPDSNLIQDYGSISWTQILREEFRKVFPDVDVNFTTAGLDQVIVRLISGVGPDVVNSAATGFQNLGYDGAFLDLNSYLERDGIDFMAEQTYWPPQYSVFQHDGQQFALPQYLGTIAVGYNVDMFMGAGLAPPDPSIHTSQLGWDGFAEIAQKLTRDVAGEGTPSVYGFAKRLRTNRVAYWMRAGGAEYYVDGDRRRSALGTPEAVAALEYLQELRWDIGALAPPDSGASLINGTAAMEEMGSWSLVNMLGLDSQGSPKVPFDWNVFPLPMGPGGDRATLATIDAYAVNKDTAHPEESYQLVKFLAGPVANQIKAQYMGLQPAHRAVVPDYIRLMEAINQDVYDVDIHVFTDAGPYAHPQLLYTDQTAASSMINSAYNQIFEDRAPVQSVWPETIARLNTILQQDQGDVSPVERITWNQRDWNVQDINTSIPGKTTVRGNQIAITASGWDIWRTEDGMRYVYQDVEGDFDATVLLHSVSSVNDWSKAGIMIRSGVAPEAANVTVLGTYSNGIVMQERPLDGASSSTAGRTSERPDFSQTYLRLVRRGHVLTGYYSRDGRDWTELAQVTIDLPEQALLGLAVASHEPVELGEAIFSEWNLVQ